MYYYIKLYLFAIELLVMNDIIYLCDTSIKYMYNEFIKILFYSPMYHIFTICLYHSIFYNLHIFILIMIFLIIQILVLTLVYILLFELFSNKKLSFYSLINVLPFFKIIYQYSFELTIQVTNNILP